MFATATAPILWELCDSLRARWTITPCSGALQYGTFELMCKGACLLAMCRGGSVKPDWVSRNWGRSLAGNLKTLLTQTGHNLSPGQVHGT